VKRLVEGLVAPPASGDRRHMAVSGQRSEDAIEVRLGALWTEEEEGRWHGGPVNPGVHQGRMMDVLFLSPAYPAEMRHYTRALASVGARVWGVGDGGPPAELQSDLAGWLSVPSLLDEADLMRRVVDWLGPRRPDRIESLWEPLVLAAAHLREHYDVPGMSPSIVSGFRDKELMKQRIKAAGLRVPHSARIRTISEALEAVLRIGYPLILKPIAGAGSADTYRCNNAAELEAALLRMRHVPEASLEEFVEGREFTFDTLSIHGTPVFENVAEYLPRPLIARTVHDISPAICTIRDLGQPHLQGGIALGRKVLKALGMGTGFTHMEWYLKADGEVVFGEIGCRPGGAHLVDQMNLTCDTDLFTEWARAVCWHSFEGRTERRYNTAIVFKRARGDGRITRIDGLDSFIAEHGQHVAWENLLEPGQHRRNWKQTLVSDGFLIVRHPSWEATLELARQVGERITLHAAP